MRCIREHNYGMRWFGIYNKTHFCTPKIFSKFWHKNEIDYIRTEIINDFEFMKYIRNSVAWLRTFLEARVLFYMYITSVYQSYQFFRVEGEREGKYAYCVSIVYILSFVTPLMPYVYFMYILSIRHENLKNIINYLRVYVSQWILSVWLSC